MDSVQDYNELLGVETLHPLVSVVDFSELESVRHCLKNFGFYCIYLKHINCGPLLYGRNQYDYREGTLVFIAPGQVSGIDDGKVSYGYKGWCLMFHPDLLRGTSLARRMADYSFFSSSMAKAQSSVSFMAFRSRGLTVRTFLIPKALTPVSTSMSVAGSPLIL